MRAAASSAAARDAGWHERFARANGIEPGDGDPYQAVDARAAQFTRDRDRVADAATKLGHACRIGGVASLSGCGVAERQVEEHLLEPAGAQSALDLRDLVLVRRHVLHAPEAGSGGRVDAVEKRQFGIQEGEVCGIARHANLLLAPATKLMPECATPVARLTPLSARS
jgi:hypothetical protein